MENFSNLKEYVSIQKKSFLISSVDIVEECGTYEPALSDYVITLDREKLEGFKEYIRESDIRDKEHTLKSLERIPAAVMRVMVNRINMESLTLGFINEYGGVQGVLDWCNNIQNNNDNTESEMESINNPNILDDMFSDVGQEKNESKEQEEHFEEEKETPEEKFEGYVVEKPEMPEFSKTYENNEKLYKELTMGMGELQENVRYLIGTVNLLAAKSGLNIRDTRGILNTNEILKVVASMRGYSDKQFRDIVEGVFLKAQTEEQRRIVSDMLGEILNFVETRQEENGYE